MASILVWTDQESHFHHPGFSLPVLAWAHLGHVSLGSSLSLLRFPFAASSVWGTLPYLVLLGRLGLARRPSYYPLPGGPTVPILSIPGPHFPPATSLPCPLPPPPPSSPSSALEKLEFLAPTLRTLTWMRTCFGSSLPILRALLTSPA